MEILQQLFEDTPLMVIFIADKYMPILYCVKP